MWPRLVANPPRSELMAEGALKYIKLGRTRRIRRTDLEAYVANLAPLPN